MSRFSQLTNELPDALHDRICKEKQPTSFSLMLATLTDERFSDPDWIYERKFDGERCAVLRNGGKVHLRTRNDKSIGSTYPELVRALETSGPDLIADGEIVAFDGHVTSFSKLQGRLGRRNPSPALIEKTPVYIYLFDLMHVDGHNLTELALRERKKLLRKAIDFTGPVRFTQHRNEDGEGYYREACEKGWEGIIAKDARSSYVSSRSRSWLKFKCVAGQELVIAGFTEPRGSRTGFGAILVGYYEGQKLHYAGKVGTGFDEERLRQLRKQFDDEERDESPFVERVRERDAHWLNPKLVAEIGFTEWTRSGKLRHPRFLGLRRDKNARDVVKESAKESQ